MWLLSPRVQHTPSSRSPSPDTYFTLEPIVSGPRCPVRSPSLIQRHGHRAARQPRRLLGDVVQDSRSVFQTSPRRNYSSQGAPRRERAAVQPMAQCAGRAGLSLGGRGGSSEMLTHWRRKVCEGMSANGRAGGRIEVNVHYNWLVSSVSVSWVSSV